MNEMQHNQQTSQGKNNFTNFTISEGAWTLSEKVRAKIIDNDYPQKVLSPSRKNDEENNGFIIFLNEVFTYSIRWGNRAVMLEGRRFSSLDM
jgi:hypothetical protein